MQRASRRVLRAHQQAITVLMIVIGSRAGAAGVEPARSELEIARPAGSLGHDVSILPDVGRHLGSQPRANTSITIMRAPQRGHGQGSTWVASAAMSRCTCGSAAGGSSLRRTRAVAMLLARLALAKSP